MSFTASWSLSYVSYRRYVASVPVFSHTHLVHLLLWWVCCEQGSLLELDVVEYHMVGEGQAPGEEEGVQLASYIGDGKVSIWFAKCIMIPHALSLLTRARVTTFISERTSCHVVVLKVQVQQAVSS